MHDHPWNVRTFILRGWYSEERASWNRPYDSKVRFRFRMRGDTARLLFGEYHRITAVSPGGVWTLFITGKKRGTWGFQVNGTKAPWREYLNVRVANKGEPNE